MEIKDIKDDKSYEKPIFVKVYSCIFVKESVD